MRLSDIVTEQIALKKYKVVWGPNPREPHGAHIINAVNDMEAKKAARKILKDTYGDPKFHGQKVLYAVELQTK